MFSIFPPRFVHMKFFYVAKNGMLKSVWMLPMAFTKVQPVCLAQFLRRRNCVCHTSNIVKDRVYDYTSSALQLKSPLPSASKKKLQILVNKIHPEYETRNFVGYQSSFKSLYSTNQQLSMKDQSSQPTICKPKGTAPACFTVLFLHVLL